MDGLQEQQTPAGSSATGGSLPGTNSAHRRSQQLARQLMAEEAHRRRN